MSAQNSNLTNLGEVQSVAESRKERIETSKMLEAVEKIISLRAAVLTIFC